MSVDLLRRLYISALNNKMQGDLSRLPNALAIQHGINPGFNYVDVGQIAKSYFERRRREFSPILPSNNMGRAQTIAQYVGKRIARYLRAPVVESTHIIASGVGDRGWGFFGNSREIVRFCGTPQPGRPNAV